MKMIDRKDFICKIAAALIIGRWCVTMDKALMQAIQVADRLPGLFQTEEIEL